MALLQEDLAAKFLCNSYNSEQLVIISGLPGMSFPFAHLAKILSVKWKTIYFMIHFRHSLLQKDTDTDHDDVLGGATGRDDDFVGLNKMW